MNYYKSIFCAIISLCIIPMIHMEILLKRKQKERKMLKKELSKELSRLKKKRSLK